MVLFLKLLNDDMKHEENHLTHNSVGKLSCWLPYLTDRHAAPIIFLLSLRPDSS